MSRNSYFWAQWKACLAEMGLNAAMLCSFEAVQVLQSWRGSQCLTQLSMADADDPRKTMIYKCLDQRECLSLIETTTSSSKTQTDVHQ